MTTLGDEGVSSSCTSIHAPTDDLQELLQTEKLFYSGSISEREDLAARQARLASFVSREVLPRLLELSKKEGDGYATSKERSSHFALRGHEPERLSNIILGNDLAAATSYITALRDDGLSLEALYLELLAPTARLLGELWERDESDFIDVTIGLARLQYLLSVFNKTYVEPELGTKRQILIALTPGNQHSFGASMLERFFEAAGWRVQTEYSGNREAIANAVRDKWFAVIGLSIASDRQLETLELTIADVKKESCNRHIGVIVGGPILRDKPELSEQLGADTTSPNAPMAVVAAQKLLDAALTRE